MTQVSRRRRVTEAWVVHIQRKRPDLVDDTVNFGAVASA